MEKSGLWNSNLSISRVLVLNQSPINTKPLGSKIRTNRGPPVQKISLTQKVLLNWYFEKKITFLGKFGFKNAPFFRYLSKEEEMILWPILRKPCIGVLKYFRLRMTFKWWLKATLGPDSSIKLSASQGNFWILLRIKKKLSYYGSFSKIWRKNRFLKIQNSNTIP